MTAPIVTADQLRHRLAAFEATPAATRTRSRRSRVAATAVAVGLVAMVAGVAFARWTQHDPVPPAAAPASVTAEQAAATYRAAVAPVNTAYTAFVERTSSWTDSTAPDGAAADARPLGDAFGEVVSAVRSLAPTYPAAKPQFERAIRAVATVQADLVALDRLHTDLSVDEWLQQFHRDIDRLTAASNEVRAQLGLPPALTSPNLPRG